MRSIYSMLCGGSGFLSRSLALSVFISHSSIHYTIQGHIQLALQIEKMKKKTLFRYLLLNSFEKFQKFKSQEVDLSELFPWYSWIIQIERQQWFFLLLSNNTFNRIPMYLNGSEASERIDSFSSLMIQIDSKKISFEQNAFFFKENLFFISVLNILYIVNK